MKRTVKRTLLAALAAGFLAVTAGGFWLHSRLQGSLPQLEGERALEGLSAQVLVERDALGIPTIRGANRLDVAQATGFLHAQDRFFQMDLLRRQAAGELAELFGAAALPLDRAVRVHRFRMRARAAAAASSPSEAAILERYAAGVNAGLAALAAAPFEYLLLGVDPQPWKPEDTTLAVYAMYLVLQDSQARRESALGVMHDLLPEALFDFLAPRGTEWDAPLAGELFQSPPLPGPEVFNLRSQPGAAGAGPAKGRGMELWPPPAAGSNNWAVAGRLTAHGGALVANDMHLPLAVPNTWYRASFVFPEGNGRDRRVTGVTLPGTPSIVVGSNGEVAWGFTNSYGDWADLVILLPAPGATDSYQAPQGPRPFERSRETIHVKGQREEVLEILSTIWGPVIDTDHLGRRRALRWVAHDRQAVNLNLIDLETAGGVEEAIEVANRAGAPGQNFVVADSAGHIGWTLLGPIPRRQGFDGQLPQSWADGRCGWRGWLMPEEYPRIIDPASGRLWTANARVVGGEMLTAIGDGGYNCGARARQIRDHLLAIEQADEGIMLAMQLDDRALFLERWQQLLLEVLTPEALSADSRRRAMREQVQNWGGRAAIDSAGYRLVRSFRSNLAEQVFASLTASCKAADARFNYGRFAQLEEPLWRLARERPVHLLDSGFADWQQQFLAAVDTTLDYFLQDGSKLEDHTWGERNTVRIRHPLSAFIPGSARWLDMPAVPLPGDSDMPRVQSPAFGASERMAVAPGREAQGILHMPCGQSGHPLSPHYRDAQDAWVRGQPTPLLPGPAVHRLVLNPVSETTAP